MRMIAAGIGVVALTCMTLHGQAPKPPTGFLTLFVSPVEYVSPTYVADPNPETGATRLLFEGEPLGLTVDVRNDNDIPAELVTKASPGFQISVRRDRKPITTAVGVSNVTTRLFLDTRRSEEWTSRMRLGPRETMRWTVDTGLETVSPGIYEIAVEAMGIDQNGNKVYPRVPQQVVEVRARTADSALEMAVRATERLLLRQEYSEAEKLARTALGAYPNSAVGYVQLSKATAGQGRTAEAIQSLETALDILDRNADALLQRFRGSSIPQMIVNLGQRINGLRALEQKGR